MNVESAPVIGRLAPSPTGLLHLGHARTFLVAWWSARSQGGRVVLRIEDLDEARSEPELVGECQRDLEWLGLDWDGPVYLQSSGSERLSGAIHRLLNAGLAYPCTCTRGDILLAQSAPQQGVSELRYPGTCRGRYRSLEEAERLSGRRAGIRFLVPDGMVTFEDRIAKSQSFDVQAEIGDFLIARRDGAAAYQLAVVVDDAFQNVTEVVRGDDLLASTARQWWLQQALGYPHPTWAHVPLVLDADGRRLAKREAALSLRELREGGVAAERIVAWAARSLDLECPDRVTAKEVIPEFVLARVPLTPVRLDRTPGLDPGS